MQEVSGKRQEARGKTQWNSLWCVLKSDVVIACALTLVGALTRVPYLELIPVYSDEVMQTVLALNIRLGDLPLTGTDAYTGPAFLYILAACLRVFGATPVAPRIVAMVMGALTVGLTYWLARICGLRWQWAAISGLLMAVNPHHILISSHYAGATYVLPLFSTAFLVALTLAVKCESGWGLVAASVLLALTLQANPVPALTIPGVAIWFLLQRKRNIGLHTPWPYLALIALVLVYSPLIIYNIQTGFATIGEIKSRDYIWQPNLSLLAYIQNFMQFTLQLLRQVSGVLDYEHGLSSLVGLPLLFGVWAVAGLIHAMRHGTTLPALAVGSQVLIMPWLSSNYKMISVSRFTNHLTPLIVVAMAILAADMWTSVTARLRSLASIQVVKWITRVLVITLSLWPLVSLLRYYESRVAIGETNAIYLAFIDEFMQQWRGEKVMVSDTMLGFAAIRDMSEFNPTVYLLAVNKVPYEIVPFGRLMERLATRQESGRVSLVLSNEDLPRAQLQADLIVWNSPAIQSIQRQKGYGVYTIPDAQQVHKPTFVLSDGTPLTTSVRAVQANFADQLRMIGYEPKSKLAPGERFIVNLYWKTIGAIPESYTSFLHLTGPDGRLVAQDDHELGRGIYRTFVWQADEVVRERYEWVMPKDTPNGDYTLRVGVYQFPSLKRLSVRSTNTSAQDDLIWLDTIHVGP